MIDGINSCKTSPVCNSTFEGMVKLDSRDDLCLASTLTHGGSEKESSGIVGTVVGFFNSIWGGFKWLVSKVFFCYDCTSVLGGGSEKLTLEDIKKGAKVLEELKTKHTNRDTLTDSWQKAFDGFSKNLQRGLMECYFQALAKGPKRLEGEGMEEFVEGCFKIEENKRSALLFIRNLNFDGKTNTDPLQELPKYFNYLEETSQK